MSSSLARTGRDKQRYEDQLRLVSGCIPYKFENNGENKNCNLENELRVLMISTPNRDDLVFPKGGWEDDETISEAANREALEEAGVTGILSENPLGVWEFRSKSKQNSCSLEGGCRGYMFAMEVVEELDSWPEQSSYNRKWLTPEDAFKLCRYDWMRDALKRFLTTITKESTNGTREEFNEHSSIPADSVTEHQILSTGSFGKPRGVQCLQGSCSKCFVQG
ncbi:NUDIX domain-containing protein [Cephalotus follicularis]|uniref:NUDIX domain-containing protein n=1 Tax=Cephalotus follicularis TaxID=3775 RepID=A0A1Q3CR49_CEPFO|nr:NUDIX domain-containing protein [Cephalotus follicularis]